MPSFTVNLEPSLQPTLDFFVFFFPWSELSSYSKKPIFVILDESSRSVLVAKFQVPLVFPCILHLVFWVAEIKEPLLYYVSG